MLTEGALLKECIEDLEWTAIGSNSSSVEVCMQRQPRRLFFRAQAAGSLQVDCSRSLFSLPSLSRLSSIVFTRTRKPCASLCIYMLFNDANGGFYE